MPIAGIRGTGDWGTDERPKNFREMILFRNPNGDAPLTAMLAKMGTESTDDSEFSWWEEELSVFRLALAAQITNTATTVTFTTSAAFDALSLVPGDLLMVENATTEPSQAVPFEIVEVTAVSNATTITVTRGVAGSTAATAATAVQVTKLGSVFAEATGAPAATSRNPVKKTNYAEIFKTAYELSGTAEQTNARTGDPLKNDKKRRSFDHSSALEMAFLFNGAPTETTGTPYTGGSAKPKRYTGSLRYYLSTNRTVFTTTVTEAAWINSLAPVFDFSGTGTSNERLGFCGNGYLMALNRMAKAGMQVQANETVRVYGMELRKWIMPQGTIYLRTHPLMNTHGRFTLSAFFIEGSQLKYRPLRGRDTKPFDNIQPNDADAKKGQWMTEAGLEVQHERTMAYHGNLVT